MKYNLVGYQEHYAEWKMPILKHHILYVCIFMAFFKWQNYGDGEQISDCQGLGVVEGIGVTIKG